MEMPTIPATNASTPPPLLPQPMAQHGAEPRNYVAYIPVPISDDEEEGEDEEYYDDDEYYEEDEEEDEYEDEYYYEEEDTDVKPPPRRRRPSRKKPSKSNRRKYQPKNDQERVPFLVPLMMVPESEIGIDKPFSFAGRDPKLPNIAKDFAPDRPQLNRPLRPFQPGNFRRPPRPRFNNNRVRPINRRVLQDNIQGLHDRPGPPYPGPNPRAPHLPLDKTIIHPSNHHPIYHDLPDVSESKGEEVEVVYVEPVTKTSTVSTTTTTKAPTVIVLQQNPYPYPNMYHPQPQYHPGQYQYHYPPPMTTISTTTATTTTTTTTTTTKNPKKRRKKKRKKNPGQITYQNMAPDVLIDGILPPEPPNR